ncbi:MAG: hypothetical protein NTW86_13085, partial [Candidatus Sumerlaeota bacterium]|nr:hypothetical protein [Candidatus Sumerlaeota bacterium]
MLSVDEGGGRALVNVRPTLGQRAMDVVAAAQRTIAESAPEALGLSVAVEGIAYDPLYLDPAKYPEFFEALRTAYALGTGREATLEATPGTTFAKAFPNAICFGPTDEAEEDVLAHKVDERLRVEHL